MAWFPSEGYSMRVSENVKRGFLDDSKLFDSFFKIYFDLLFGDSLRRLYKSQFRKNIPNTLIINIKRSLIGKVHGRHLNGSLWVMNQILITF
jgi:hypothetical protein